MRYRVRLIASGRGSGSCSRLVRWRSKSSSTRRVPVLRRRLVAVPRPVAASVVASTGATGLGSLTVESEQPYVAEVLRFRKGELVAIDSIDLQGTLGDFVVQRTLITDEMRKGEPDEAIDADPEEPTLEDLEREGQPVPTAPTTMPLNPLLRGATTTTSTSTTVAGG